MQKLNTKKIIYLLCFITLFLSAGSLAHAKNPDFVSVFHSDGSAFSSKPLVFENNILPGDLFRKKFVVRKKDTGDQVLMMKFKKTLPPIGDALSRKIFVRIKRLSDGKYLRIAHGRKRQSLAELYRYKDLQNSDAFAFDKIAGVNGSSFSYELWFRFSPRTGNYFQNKSTKFDLSVGVFSKPAGPCKTCICPWKGFCCDSKNWLCRSCGKIIFGL